MTRGSKQVAKPIEHTTKDKEVLDADDYVLPQPTRVRKSWVYPQILPVAKLAKEHVKDVLQHKSNVSRLE